ncbi:MAG: zinc ribbon domain-containing protein [Eubacteriales bacterium]|nr:zinc ribbon domain-containing protein [Eubacteriales bacterium]
MYCSSCGQELGTSDLFCPKCGAQNPAITEAKTAAATATPESAQQVSGPAYTRADYDPTKPKAYPQTPATQSAEKPGVTASIVMAVLNIVLIGFGVSTILGVIALIYTLMAISATDARSFRTKMAAARALNLFGLGMVVLQIVIIGAVVLATINLFG